MSVWSSGMIPALGAGGPGFKPRNGPFLDVLLSCCRLRRGGYPRTQLDSSEF